MVAPFDWIPRPAALPADSYCSVRDPAPLLARTLAQWPAQQDLWVFGYGSLIWKPEFDYAERRAATVYGWHRALKMWSRINRGTPESPGLVFGMLSGGSCKGLAFRIAPEQAQAVFAAVWEREMIATIYDPRWLTCHTPQGPVQALAFTLSRHSPSHTGPLSDADTARIFAQAHGRYGSTYDYARSTYEELLRHGIHDHALQRMLALAPQPLTCVIN